MVCRAGELGQQEARGDGKCGHHPECQSAAVTQRRTDPHRQQGQAHDEPEGDVPHDREPRREQHDRERRPDPVQAVRSPVGGADGGPVRLGGDLGQGVLPIGPAQKSSRPTTLRPVVADPLSEANMPTPPASCSAAMELVPDACQVAGSVVPTFHTLARRVVGAEPVTWNRTASRFPGATVSPATLA